MDKKELEEKIKAWKVQRIVVSLKSVLDRGVPKDEVKMNYVDMRRMHQYLMQQPLVLDETLDAMSYFALCWKLFKIVFLRKGKDSSLINLTGFISEYPFHENTEVIDNINH